jgi:hypothetical protein
MYANNIINNAKKINTLRGEYRKIFSIGVEKIFPISWMKSLIYQNSFWVRNRSFEFAWRFFSEKLFLIFQSKVK